jgi:hypothetical protein
VLRELYPRDSGGSALEVGEWWGRFEAELARDPERPPETRDPEVGDHPRRVLTSANAPAAVAGELASSGASTLAVCADAALRVGMAREGLHLADYAEIECSPGLCRDFIHVVLVDPPAFPHLEPALTDSTQEGGYLHRVWGEAEWRFALGVLDEQFAQRPTLIASFRDLRDAGEASGEELRQALLGNGPHPRNPETAARCFRVLVELGLVQGVADGGAGMVGVVSSKSTDLERSAAFRAYSARHQEARRCLERQRQP